MRGLKRRGVTVLTALVFLSAACSAQSTVPALEQRANDLNKTIMCPICPGESIDQAQNALAVQMRGIVREKIADGWTDQQVQAFFVERYGLSVILEPPRRGFGLVAWVVPPAAVVAAVIAFLGALRWMRRPAMAQSGAQAQSNPTADGELDSYYRRIEAALGYGDDADADNARGRPGST